MTLQKTWESVAPSILAASMYSVGTALIAADRITMANPVWIQTMMIISQKLLYGVSWTKFTVWAEIPPSSATLKPPTPTVPNEADEADEEPADEQDERRRVPPLDRCRVSSG